MNGKKVIKSLCEKAWFFDASEEDNILLVGLACFAPNCPSETIVEINGTERTTMTPTRAIDSPVPMRMINARLPLLSLIKNE